MTAVTTSEIASDDLVYPRERVLGAITLVLGLLVWLALIIGTVGVGLVLVGVGALVYLFAHSALIARVKGNGVELSTEQFPDLYAQFLDCCKRLDIPNPPQAYILNGNGLLNAFATKFLRDRYIVLTSDIVDAMQGNPEGVRFYMGHELGHLRMKHISKASPLAGPLAPASGCCLLPRTRKYLRSTRTGVQRLRKLCGSCPQRPGGRSRAMEKSQCGELCSSDRTFRRLLDVLPRTDFGIPLVDEARGTHNQRGDWRTRAQSIRLPRGDLRALWRSLGGWLLIPHHGLHRWRPRRRCNSGIPGLHD